MRSRRCAVCGTLVRGDRLSILGKCDDCFKASTTPDVAYARVQGVQGVQR